jgi:hypothetical protein
LRSDLQIEHSLQLELAGTAQLTVRNHSMPNSTGPPWDSAAGHFDRMKALRAWFQQTPRIHPKPLACAYRLKVEDGAGLHRARDRLLVERTALINQLRGMLRAMTYFAAFPIVFM